MINPALASSTWVVNLRRVSCAWHAANWVWGREQKAERQIRQEKESRVALEEHMELNLCHACRKKLAPAGLVCG